MSDQTEKHRITRIATSKAMRYGFDPVLFLAIIARESAFNTAAKGASGEIGLAQLHEAGAIAEWEQFKMPKITDYWAVENNLEVAAWYIGKRIPDMLRHYGKPVTDRNIIIAYNAGISRVISGGTPPKITQDYIVFVEDYRAKHGRNQKVYWAAFMAFVAASMMG